MPQRTCSACGKTLYEGEIPGGICADCQYGIRPVSSEDQLDVEVIKEVERRLIAEGKVAELIRLVAMTSVLLLVLFVFQTAAHAESNEVVACERQPAGPDYDQPTGFYGRWFGNSGSAQWRLIEDNQIVLTGSGAYDIVQIFKWNVWYSLQHEVSPGAWQVSGFCRFRYEKLDVPVNVSMRDTTEYADLSERFVEIPIIIDSTLDGREVYSFQFDLRYDETIIKYGYLNGTGMLADFYDFTVSVNNEESGVLKFAGYGTAPIEGFGTLLYVGFDIVGRPYQSTAISFENFMFNEGTPPAMTKNGSITIVPLKLSGYSRYWSNQTGLSNIEANAYTPTEAWTDVTDEYGFYEIEVPANSFEVRWTRPRNEQDPAITAYDAALIAQFVVGYSVQCPIEACDVTHNGDISALDASEVAKYAVGLPSQYVGTWVSSPDVAYFGNVIGDQTQNTTMYLLGDSSGNWGTEATTAMALDSSINTVVVTSNTASLTIGRQQPFISAELVFDHDVVSATAQGFEVTTNGNKIVMYRTDPVQETEIQIEFAPTTQREVRLTPIMLNEQVYYVDHVIPLDDEMPPLLLETFLPYIVN